MRLVLAVTLVLLVACDYDPRGRCQRDSECLAGQVCQGGVCAAPGEVPPNHAPVAAGDAYPVTAGGTLECLGPCLLANDVDPDGDPLEAERASVAAHGVVYVSPDGSFRYVPEAGYTGADAFAYRASDGALRSAPATVTLTVAP